MSLIKFRLNQTYRLGVVVWRLSKWLPRNEINLIILNLYVAKNASHQVSAQSDLRFERRCCFEELQKGNHISYLEYDNGTILAILNFHVALMPSNKFWLHSTYYSGADIVWRVSRWRPFCKLERNDFKNSESHVNRMPPIKFQLNPT